MEFNTRGEIISQTAVLDACLLARPATGKTEAVRAESPLVKRKNGPDTPGIIRTGNRTPGKIVWTETVAKYAQRRQVTRS